MILGHFYTIKMLLNSVFVNINMLNIVSSLFSKKELVESVNVVRPLFVSHILPLKEERFKDINDMNLENFASKLTLFYNFPGAFAGYRKGDRLFYVPTYISPSEREGILSAHVNLDLCLMESYPLEGRETSASILEGREAFYNHYPLVDDKNNILYFADIPERKIFKALDFDISRFNETYGENYIVERRKNSPEQKMVSINL